jgi:hypothetical protein
MQACLHIESQVISIVAETIPKLRPIAIRLLHEQITKKENDLKVKYGHGKDSYVKTGWTWKSFNYEPKAHEIFQRFGPLNLTPKYIAHGIIDIAKIYVDDKDVETCELHYLVTELYGESLWDKYKVLEYTITNKDKYSETFETFNPLVWDCIPDDIKEKVKENYHQMLTLGYKHPDPNSSNYLIDANGIIKAIDFDDDY